MRPVARTPFGDPLNQFLRIVDKPSIYPPTTYIPSSFVRLLGEKKDLVEYRQANLTVKSVVQECFEAPEGRKAFDFVYDLTGEKAFDKAPIVRPSSLLWP